MKTYIKLFTLACAFLLLNACNQDYIDSISKVDPGTDESDPVVTVNFPPEGYELQTNDAVASIKIDFKVVDDIEISSISVMMDGSEIVSYNEFKDYRVAMKKYTYDNVTTGQHVLSITATDIDGKSTTKDVNFAKAPPYVPLYEGEVFYMPFNNEFREMNSLSLATAVGSPGFTDGIQGGTAYAGAADAYLTFPSSILQGATAISASFWIKIDDAMDRAGILVLAPPADNNNDRSKGFRFFREASNGGATQRYKLNVGTGSSDSWFDGGAEADVTPNTGEWVHMAFSISETEASVYINGEVVKQGAFDGIDITDCDQISIMSGAPNWTGWDHLSDGSAMDELRIFNKALSQDEIRTLMLKEQASFYMDFNGDFKESLTGTAATVQGSPTFVYGAGVVGDAYMGAANSYLTFSTADVDVQADEFSTSFWLNINNVPDRAGILTMGPEDTENAEYPTKQNNRKSGFRFFREASNAGATQRFKLNVGNGTADTWIDGGEAADVDPTTGNWVHFAFAVSSDKATVYIDGAEVKQGDFDGIDWTGCDLLSIMSGAPRFSAWGHLSDESRMDELYLFKKALTAEEVTLLMNDGM
ncbi:Concanavalin A-like lectin/glucanases superfamily protein [Saccharicrinis carchari]|uniref:Concanavalin A-like lectin/glucanases superfamily protein n=1 Tax=Saccharicrinis carchari TaxID=1168039 RepID=A0A521C4L5_SACCC|nr:LamG domain-containing protein [Saccharicrinis carchari]SMO54417.1 Concanavalin A-like lectin/glucanases superfamily protein [Saccharicrinis carchari]